MSDLIGLAVDPANAKTLGELRSLSSELQQKGVRAALKAGAKPLQIAMKAAAPDDKKTAGSRLAKAINTTQAKTGQGVMTGLGGRNVSVGPDEVAVIVGPNKKVDGRRETGIAWMLEVGTKAHKISAKNNVLVIGKNFLSGDINHPGIRARNWMANSFIAASTQVEGQFYQGLEKWMDKHGR